MTVEVGDTLCGLIQKIYGAYTYRYNRAVLDANPRLVNPDRLNAGESLVFPTLDTGTAGRRAATWWVSLSREEDLEAAVSVLRRETDGRFPLRILTQETPREGLTFWVVLTTCLPDQVSAEHEKSRVESLTQHHLEIVCLNGKDQELTDERRASNVERPTSNERQMPN